MASSSSTTAAGGREPSKEYDLTLKIACNLDRHLVFPLLDFLEQKQMYTQQEIARAQLDLVKDTNMIDFIGGVYTKLGLEIPSTHSQRRDEVVEKLINFERECGSLFQVLSDAELVNRLREGKQFTMAYLMEKHEVTPQSLDAVFHFAKFQFECGNYSSTAELLYHYRALSNDKEKCFLALWGKLAAEILMSDWDTALESMNRLKDAIDNRHVEMSAAQQLQQRTWLIHWSLFVFFNHAHGRNGIIDMFFQAPYMSCIQTSCPHILRYLTTTVITNKRRRNVLKDLVAVIQQERYSYQDPITEFLECLYVNFDFSRAQAKLKECEVVLANDYFLLACCDDFIESARLFIFETYCRIHQCIDIVMLAEKLSMHQDEAERWIVNLIRNARLDAKIDSEQNHVNMGTTHPSVYQQVIEQTKGLSFRSHVMAQTVGTALETKNSAR